MFHCRSGRGWEVRDRPVVVYGAGDVTDRQAALPASWTDDVTGLVVVGAQAHTTLIGRSAFVPGAGGFDSFG